MAPCASARCDITSRMALLMFEGAVPSAMFTSPTTVLLAAVELYSPILSFAIYFSH